MDLRQLTEELTCPLALTLLSDPITLPCCGKAVSRSSLRSALVQNPSCPLCRTYVSAEVADTAARNRVAQALLDALVSTQEAGAGGSTTGPAASAMRMRMNDEDEAPKMTATYCLLPVPTSTSTPSGTSVPPTATQVGQPHQDRSVSNSSASTSQRVGEIARLQFKVTNAMKLNIRRNLCILVVDKSGSMSGSPWNQASLAMKHIVSMARGLSHFAANTTLKIVCYDSRATELSCEGSVDDVHARIDRTRANYSTSFRAAFEETVRVMRRTVVQAGVLIQQGQVPEGTVSPMPGVVQILFMTDGQAHEDRTRLADELNTQLVKFRADCSGHQGVGTAVPDITVHAMGFSSGCDRALLDRIRNAGTHPGQFRYAEPGDSDDALCGRLTGMFEGMAAHGGCELLVERLALPSATAASVADDAVEETWEFLGQDGEILPVDEKGSIRVQLRTKPDGVGTAVAWVSIHARTQATEVVLPVAVTCNAGQERTMMEEEVQDEIGARRESDGVENGSLIPPPRPDFTITATEDPSFASVDAIKRAWVGVRLHVIAESAIACATAAADQSTPLPAAAVRLWGSFLEHRLRAVSILGSDAHGRVPSLLEQLRGLSNWKSKDRSMVSIGRLRDLSSASAFSSGRAPVASSVALSLEQRAAATQTRANNAANAPSSWSTALNTDELLLQYSGNNKSMKRNPLQSAIMDWGQRAGADAMVSDMLNSMEAEDQREAVIATDLSGNSALHLASYHGQFDAVTALMDAVPFFDVDTPNDYNETPVTIAIKKRGYHKTVEVLLSLGGSVSEDRVDDLIAFCRRFNYLRTAAFLRRRKEEGTLGRTGDASAGRSTPTWSLKSAADLPALVFEEGTPRVVVQSRLRNAVAQGRPVDWLSLVRIALKFPDRDLLKSGLEHIESGDVDHTWVFADCFPRKPDAEDTPLFLETLELMVDFIVPSVLDASLPDSEDTLLHKAVIAGSLPHTEFLVARGVHPDVTNALGNTPLIVSCEKRYPCLVDFFITAGSDVDARNMKGMTPIATAVQMGSLRIVESLIAAGATVDGPTAVTNQLENLFHLAVRNNRQAILEVILDRADPNTLLEADQNGFTPILAAVEGDRKECLNLLLDSAKDYTRRGIPGFVPVEAEDATSSELPILEWKTPCDSPLIPDATALHVAVFYNRKFAVAELLRRGADPNAFDGHGLTPLHRACQTGSADVVYALLAHGADPIAVDETGRTPASYGRSFPEVTGALVGPIPGPLRAFAAGDMEATAVSSCLDIIRAPDIPAEPGLFDAPNLLDSKLDDIGQTALMVAVSHGNALAAEVLFEGGASPTKRDRRGLSAAAWAQMVKSQRMLGIFGIPPQPLLPPAERHRQWKGADAMAIFLGGRRDPSWPSTTSKTTLHHRLVLLAEAFQKNNGSGQEYGLEIPSAVTLLQTAPRTGAIDRVAIAPPGSAEQLALDADRWSCKIAAAGCVAAAAGAGGSSNKQMLHQPRHVFAALLATQHGPLVPKINEFLERSPESPKVIPMAEKTILDFAVALFDAIMSVDDAEGSTTSAEVYAIAPPGFQYSALFPGSEITLNGFASATTEWPVALSALDSICRGRGEGTGTGGGEEALEKGGKGVLVLAIKAPKSARAVWTQSSSAFPEDREVMFPPGTAFRASRWYYGDRHTIALQGNRSKSCGRGLSDEEIAKFGAEDGPLLIELEEVP